MQDSLSIIQELLGLESPVSFREFVSGKDYCNNQELYEYWYSQAENIPDTCSELLLGGSLGGGKSTFGDYYLAYRIYLLFHSGSPQKQLGLASNSDIYCLYFSVSLTMAKRSGYQLLYDIFNTCGWFNKYCPINKELKSSIEFVGKHFFINYASDFGHQISLNVFAFILDEANFRAGVGLGVAEEYEEVTQLYNQLLDRQLSRFARPDGSTSALAILISSASYQSSFFEKRRSAIKGDVNAHSIMTAAYEVKPQNFSKETFEVFIGSGAVEPCIISSEEHKLKVLQTANLLGTGQEEEFFRKVPLNLLKSFEADLPQALQNHCGVSTSNSSSFMTNLRFLFSSYVTDILPIFQSFELVASNGDDTQLIEYLIPENIQYRDRPHSLFLDLSVQRDAGCLCCYRYDGKDSRNYDIHTRVFSLRIIPPPFPHQTRIAKVQQFVIDLSGYLNIVCFGSDQYQSTEVRQEVNAELGLEDIRISIDSSDIPHIHWQRGLVDGRIRQIEDSVLEREVQEAKHDYKRHRVLKVKGSSDDTMQANVGAFYLSDTVGKNMGSLEDIYGEGPVNLIGGNRISKVLKDLGYTEC